MRNGRAQTPDISHDPGLVLAKAVVNAADELGLSQQDLANIIGVSPASASRMRDGRYALTGKPFELAVCLVRIFRSLDAIAGSDPQTIRGWMAADNTDLGTAPRAHVQTVAGLIDVMNYLDANRALT